MIDPRTHHYCSTESLQHLHKIVMQAKPCVIVEIGSGLADTAAVLAMVPNAHVFTFDQYAFGNGNEHLMEFTCRTWPMPNLTQIRMSSVDAATWWGRIKLPIDLIHIDGDHRKEGLYKDITLWHRWVKPGGVYVGHDWDPGHAEVQAAVKLCVDEGYLTDLEAWDDPVCVWKAKRGDR